MWLFFLYAQYHEPFTSRHQAHQLYPCSQNKQACLLRALNFRPFFCCDPKIRLQTRFKQWPFAWIATDGEMLIYASFFFLAGSQSRVELKQNRHEKLQHNRLLQMIFGPISFCCVCDPTIADTEHGTSWTKESCPCQLFKVLVMYRDRINYTERW